MRTNHKKLLGALAVAGVVAATGSAFTASGLTNDAGASQFVGGTVTQTLTGAATLADVAYGFADVPANTSVDAVTLDFADISPGSSVGITLNGSTGAWTCAEDGVDTTVWTCTGPAVDGVNALGVTVSEAAPEV